MPSATFFLTFLRARAAPAFCVGCCAMLSLVLDVTWWPRRRLPRLARALARARVGARALAAYRQSLAMANAAIAAEVHQPLDAHRHLAAQVALDGELLHLLAQLVHFGV